MRTCDGGIYIQYVWLTPQQVGRFLNDVQRLGFCQPALAIEMVLEEGDVRFGGVFRREELSIRWGMHGWSLNLNWPVVRLGHGKYNQSQNSMSVCQLDLRLMQNTNIFDDPLLSGDCTTD